MSKKRMLADVLWEAALTVEIEVFSCIAAKQAWARLTGNAYPADWGHTSLVLLRLLGCDPESDDASKVMDDTPDPAVTRSIWLLLAMHVAEAEGIEV